MDIHFCGDQTETSATGSAVETCTCAFGFNSLNLPVQFQQQALVEKFASVRIASLYKWLFHTQQRFITYSEKTICINSTLKHEKYQKSTAEHYMSNYNYI